MRNFYISLVIVAILPVNLAAQELRNIAPDDVQARIDAVSDAYGITENGRPKQSTTFRLASPQETATTFFTRLEGMTVQNSVLRAGRKSGVSVSEVEKLTKTTIRDETQRQRIDELLANRTARLQEAADLKCKLAISEDHSDIQVIDAVFAGNIHDDNYSDLEKLKQYLPVSARMSVQEFETEAAKMMVSDSPANMNYRRELADLIRLGLRQECEGISVPLPKGKGSSVDGGIHEDQ